jgi:hypothetical protein
MKILAIEVLTDQGRRTVKLAAPIEVDARGDAPPPFFRALAETMWGLVREIARQQPSSTTPKAEA